MPTMRFMQISKDPKVLPKMFSFDSSPGRAIGQALGAGNWDETSYSSELKEELPGHPVYEVSMRRHATKSNPGPHPLERVGMITHTPTY